MRPRIPEPLSLPKSENVLDSSKMMRDGASRSSKLLIIQRLALTCMRGKKKGKVINTCQFVGSCGRDTWQCSRTQLLIIQQLALTCCRKCTISGPWRL